MEKYFAVFSDCESMKCEAIRVSREIRMKIQGSGERV